MPYDTTIHEIVNESFEEAAAIERQCVSLGWFDPVGLHNAAHRFGVCGDQFTNPGCGAIFAYVVACADLDRQPDAGECASEIKGIGGVLWPIEVLDLVLGNLDGTTPVEELVEAVAKRHRERQAARRHLQRACDLLSGRGAYQVLVTHRRPATATKGLRVPPRLQRRRARSA